MDIALLIILDHTRLTRNCPFGKIIKENDSSHIFHIWVLITCRREKEIVKVFIIIFNLVVSEIARFQRGT